MEYHINFFKSKQDYESGKKQSENHHGIGRNVRDIYEPVNIGDTVSLDFTNEELRRNKKFKHFKTNPFTVADKYKVDNDWHLEAYYSGTDDFDFDNPNK